MNRKETARALALLDACIDDAEHLAVMLALNELRGNLLDAWQTGLCETVDAAQLTEALSALPAMCREGCHPALPVKLNQGMLLLYPPAADPALCREQAARIRSLRSWGDPLEELLVHYDDTIAAETRQMLEMQLLMMSEVFGQLLTAARGRMIARAAQHRAERLEEIAAVRAGLSLQDVSDAQTDAWTACEMTNEKFTEFAAEIAASASLLQVKETQPGPAAPLQERPEEETEE